MALTLTVLLLKHKPITDVITVTIDHEGGSIGRSDDNTLVLPDVDKFVSRHHANIRFENNSYYLSDTSLSGVYINGDEKYINNAVVRLDNGMRLRIGEYEVAVTITAEPVGNDFPSMPEPLLSASNAPLMPYAALGDLGIVENNSLMNDSFPRHEELVQPDLVSSPVGFTSGLLSNHAPTFDSYIAPSILPSTEDIPENLSFDDFFADADPKQAQIVDKPKVSDDFDAFFGAFISKPDTELLQANHPPIEKTIDLQEHVSKPVDGVARSAMATEVSLELCTPLSMTDIFAENQVVAENPGEAGDERLEYVADVTSAMLDNPAVAVNAAPDDHIQVPSVAPTGEAVDVQKPIVTDTFLLDAFLQGVGVKCSGFHTEQPAETLHRVGQMFRKLIDGTISILRSRAAFKSLCRVNMTVIKASNNNPLKFTVSTEDVLRQLLENKTEGFIASTAAIEEAFNDVMNHQLAMQAGIQASLGDLLAEFDPKIIEKQFEQGLVLQKKSKCWDRYEDTYQRTVETAVENFFGDAFVKAYEQQMRQLTRTNNQRQDE